MEKSAVSMTTSLGFFSGTAGPRHRPPGAAMLPLRWVLAASLVVSLALAIVYAPAIGWVTSAAKPALKSPLSGTWDCASNGEALGRLSVDGWTYALTTADASEARVGTFALVGKHSKTREQFVVVESGSLASEFGIRLGFHNAVVVPEVLVFNTGPGSGIRCTRM